LIRIGSSCQVWEAIEEGSAKRFALKVLRPDHKDDKEEIGFLKNEFEIGSKLTHPNIIKIYKFQTDTELPYIVLELFSELNIKQALRQGPESIAYMLEKIIEQSMEAVYFLHTKGYVHCDIKPDNFLVSREGDVKMIDFTIARKMKTGLAKLFGGKAKIQGTRSYMSPEQILGKNLDQRSDVYSFGCVMFEMVTGKPPFTGDNPNDLLNKHLSAAVPSPVVANENVTSEFATMVRSMMAKKPEDRIESMWDALKMLRGTKIFKKPPRIPEKSIFDAFPTGGKVQ
jgi:serine/threonine protein kinase